MKLDTADDKTIWQHSEKTTLPLCWKFFDDRMFVRISAQRIIRHPNHVARNKAKELTVNRIDDDTAKAVRRFLILIGDQYDIAGVIVYGSRARGTHRRDSDVDVAVLLKGKRKKVLQTALAMADMAYDVLLETGVNISPLPVSVDDWEHPESFSNPALLHNIAREGISL